MSAQYRNTSSTQEQAPVPQRTFTGLITKLFWGSIRSRLNRFPLKSAAVILLASITPALVTPAVAQQFDTRILYANSLCNHPVRLLVFHKDGQNEYHAHAWYNLRPYGESTLLNGEITLRQIVGYDLYVYAETTDGSGRIWEGRDATVDSNGVLYGVRKVPLVARNGRLEFQLSC